MYHRIPSMSLNDAIMFNQLIGQYNRGLISCDELLEELNRCITNIGAVIDTGDSADRFIFTNAMIAGGSGRKIAIEPFFHPTAHNGDRIAYHIRLA